MTTTSGSRRPTNASQTANPPGMSKIRDRAHTSPEKYRPIRDTSFLLLGKQSRPRLLKPPVGHFFKQNKMLLYRNLKIDISEPGQER